MKTILITATLSLMITYSGITQFQIGFYGGPLMSNVIERSPSDGGTTLPFATVNYRPMMGFHFSIPVAYQFNHHFAIQVEAGYQRFSYIKDQTVSIPEQYISRIDLEERIRINYLNTSVLGKLSTGGSQFELHVIAGPTVGFSGSGNVESTEVVSYLDNTNYEQWSAKSFSAEESVYNKRDFGLTIGVGAAVPLPYYKVFLEARQYQSFTKLISTENIKMSNWSMHLGVLFPLY